LSAIRGAGFKPFTPYIICAVANRDPTAEIALERFAGNTEKIA
jgi:hypothetical protein